ncbi:uncharacterized protein [Cherax quadricarinatus]|uniref:uncharacterized protein n=1 Tax=Cherax quadricarinatus TaxID=27406 RepID=UPI00387E6DD1
MNYPRMLVVLVVVVHGCGGEEVSAQHHQHWLSSNHDLLSALTWASLDHNYLNQPTLLTSLENLNLTSIESLGGSGLDLSFLEGLNKTSGSLTSTDLTFALYRPRRKRNLAIVYNQLLNIQVEVKLLFPLLNIYASDNLNIEVPFAYQMNIPVKTKTLMVGKEEEEVPLEEAIDDMTSDLEGLIAMLGVDGSGCVRKALCEVAAMPAIIPEGLTGEMLHLFLRHVFDQEQMDGTTEEDENNIVQEDSGTKEQDENPSEDQMKTRSKWNTTQPGDTTNKTENAMESEAQKLKAGTNKNKMETNEKDGEKGINLARNAGKRNVKGEEADGRSGERRERHRRWKRMKRDYAAATQHGRTGGNCAEEFPECPVSLLRLMQQDLPSV